MFVIESHRSRRFIGRIDRGEELCGALRAFCAAQDIRSASVRATGLLAAVELVPYDREAKGYTSPRRLRAFFELVQLQGTLALRDGEPTLHVTALLSRDNHDRGGGIELVGGVLVAADVVTCEFVVDTFEDLVLEREFDPMIGVHVIANARPRLAPGDSPAEPRTPIVERRPSTPAASAGSAANTPPIALSATPARPSAAKPAPVPPMRALVAKPPSVIPEGAAMSAPRRENFQSASPQASAATGELSWADAVARSEAIADPRSDQPLKPGDLLDHPKFGRCEVLRVDDGEERVSVKLANGRFVELGLAVLHLEYLRSEGTRELYRVHANRRA